MMTKSLEEKGCTLVTSFLDEETTATVSRYMQNKAKRNPFVAEGLDTVNSEYFWYADPLIEMLLENNISRLERLSGKELYPTYSYARIYSKKDVLKPHVDRGACEYSVSIHIGKSGEDSPLYIENNFGKIEKHILNPGDAVVYKGVSSLHWREPLADTDTLFNAQVMLHYVDKHGEYSDCRFDNRDELGLGRRTVCQ